MACCNEIFGAKPWDLRLLRLLSYRETTPGAWSRAATLAAFASGSLRSARAAGALLAAPSNDWFGGFELLHHRSAVWTAVLGGVPIVRATGHGTSAIYDAAGHVLAQQTSQHGPVVLVADVPLSYPEQ